MIYRSLFASLSLVLFTLLAVNVWQQIADAERSNVILLTVESLRADRVSPETTPNLLEASEKGFIFPAHRAVSGWTGTNIVTLLSGLSPFKSGVHTRGQSVAPELNLPLESLSRKGYRVSGLQGFMTMDLYKNLGLSTYEAGEDLLYWLSRRARKKEPFFLWEHYVHTHLPYRPAENYMVDWQKLLPQNDHAARQRVQQVHDKASIFHGTAEFQPSDIDAIHALQNANIREFDDWFQKFWDFYLQSGLFRNTILIVTADHGDEHGERGNVGHASTNRAGQLHEEIVRVPLYIWLPQDSAITLEEPPGTVSSHLDIMPTILARLDMSSDEQMEGRDLFSAKQNSTWLGMTSGGGFAEEDPENIDYFEYGIVHNDWKLLLRKSSHSTDQKRLYYLKEDPLETVDLSQKYPSKVVSLYSLLAPSLKESVERPVRLPEKDETFTIESPAWIFPDRSRTFSYDDLQGRFFLEWSGDPLATYVIQYRAGRGETGMEGEIEVIGPVTDFGKLTRRYWETWIVPGSPVQVRVRRSDRGGWSEWLRLETVP